MKTKIYRADNGWRYDIYTDINDLLIRQDTKPSVGGTNGFATKEEAEHIAERMIALSGRMKNTEQIFEANWFLAKVLFVTGNFTDAGCLCVFYPHA